MTSSESGRIADGAHTQFWHVWFGERRGRAQ